MNILKEFSSKNKIFYDVHVFEHINIILCVYVQTLTVLLDTIHLWIYFTLNGENIYIIRYEVRFYSLLHCKRDC